MADPQVHASHLDEAALMTRPTAELGRLSGRAMAIAAVGILAAIGGYFAAPDAFWQSYLIAYIFWIGITIGSLAVLMVQHLSGGAWTMISRRVLEAAARNVPLMAVLFLPIWFNLAKLYPWAHPDPADEKMQEIIHQKGAYLNVPFFGCRPHGFDRRLNKADQRHRHLLNNESAGDDSRHIQDVVY